MQTHDTAVCDKLSIQIETPLNPRHAVNNVNKTQAAMLAAVKRPVKTGNININRNQNCGHEQSKSHMKGAATAVRSGENAK